MGAYGNDLIVVGGLDSISNSSNEMWRTNPSTLNWQQLAAIPSSGRRGGVCFNNSTTIYYTTGIDQNNNRLKETWKIFNPTSINENIEKNNLLNVFPNPANEFINIFVENFDLTNATIELIDYSGKIIFQENITSNIIKLNTENFSTGIYVIRLTSTNKTLLSKISILH